MIWPASILALVLVAVICGFELRKPSPGPAPKHTPDCLDWQRSGTTDPHCQAIHGTDWFGPIEQETP